MGFSNYFSNSPLDGSTVPTILRINGTLKTGDTILSVFFDDLTPFYRNFYSK
jgi:hypothetical protein